MLVASALLACSGRASELETLKRQKDQTPEQLIRTFADFKFELDDRLQDHETFLKRKRGDCDDFATLASSLLTQRGYTTKLVVVRMPVQTHVVCYVKEANGILDFNHRADAQPIIESTGELEDIADKTAAYFRCKWQMASEIRYEKQRPVFVDNVFPRARESSPPAPANTVDSEVAASEKPAAAASEQSEKASPPPAVAPAAIN